MKKLFENLTDGSVYAILCVLNYVVVLTTALITKAFNNEVSTFAGVGFLVGFLAMCVELATVGNKRENAPMWCVVGVIVGSVYAYLLGA